MSGSGLKKESEDGSGKIYSVVESGVLLEDVPDSSGVPENRLGARTTSSASSTSLRSLMDVNGGSHPLENPESPSGVGGRGDFFSSTIGVSFQGPGTLFGVVPVPRPGITDLSVTVSERPDDPRVSVTVSERPENLLPFWGLVSFYVKVENWSEEGQCSHVLVLSSSWLVTVYLFVRRGSHGKPLPFRKERKGEFFFV